MTLTEMVTEWLAARAALAEMDREDHPDIIDSYGRSWIWKRGDLYVHDGTLAFPGYVIPTLSLPSASLADNPNYDRLCGVCRSGW